MSVDGVPLPPHELRSEDGHPLDDDAFRAAARSDVRRLEELCGLRSTSSILDVGCGPGRLAVGLLLEFGEIARYVGVDARRQHVEWCRQSLELGDAEFIVQDVARGGDGRRTSEAFVLPHDERFDVVSAAFGPVAHPHAVSNSLRVFRHYVNDDGAILLGSTSQPGTPEGGSSHCEDGPAAPGSPLEFVPFGGERFLELVEEAGLAVEHGTGRHSDVERTFLVVSARGGRGRFSPERLKELGRQEVIRRRLDGLEHRCRVLDDERTTLIRRLESLRGEHSAVVEDLRERLKRSRRDVRVRDRRIGEMQQRLRHAERTLGRRSVRVAVSMSNLVPRPASRRRSGTSTALVNSGRDERHESARPAPEPERRHVAPTSSPSRPPSASPSRSSGVAPDVLVVYTAVVGHYDELPSVEQFAASGVRFVCFSDVERADSRGWEIMPIEYYSNDPKRTALFVKTHPHLYFPDREWSLWIDASVGLARQPIDIVNDVDVARSDLAAFLRPDRSSVSGEADRATRLGLDVADVVEDQMRRYADAGLPDGQQLYETGVLLRRHNAEKTVALDAQWWSELESGSRRDQISFAFVCWRSGLPVQSLAPVGTGVRDHPDFECREHVVAGRFRLPRNTVEAAKDRMSWNLVRHDHASRRDEQLEDVVADVDVVIPIHDALAHVQRCVRSVESDTHWSGNLFLVDDGSNAATSRWCAQFAETRPRVHLHRHAEARGFSAASNAGLAASDAPYVVVLNSDTVVSKRWLVKLRRVMTSNSSIGLVGPLSNAASWQSIPSLRSDDGALAVNSLPAGVSLEEMNTFLEELTHDLIIPLVPLLNGFCLMFRREVLDAVGGFDAVEFPRGYGEEVDLALRVTDAGFLCAVAADTYVFHAKSQSFGAVQRDELKVAGRNALRDRYGAARLDRVAASTRQHPALEFVRAATERLFAAPGC